MDQYLLKVLNTEDLLEKDMVCNEIVANLRADDDSVSVITLNPPYILMADLTKVSLGRRTQSLTEPILQTLNSLLLSFGSIQNRLQSVNLLIEGLQSKSTTDLQFLL